MATVDDKVDEVELYPFAAPLRGKRDLKKYIVCNSAGEQITNITMIKPCQEVAYKLGELVYCPREMYERCNDRY